MLYTYCYYMTPRGILGVQYRIQGVQQENVNTFTNYGASLMHELCQLGTLDQSDEDVPHSKTGVYGRPLSINLLSASL